jgi:hypothetical protein
MPPAIQRASTPVPPSTTPIESWSSIADLFAAAHQAEAAAEASVAPTSRGDSPAEVQRARLQPETRAPFPSEPLVRESRIEPMADGYADLNLGDFYAAAQANSNAVIQRTVQSEAESAPPQVQPWVGGEGGEREAAALEDSQEAVSPVVLEQLAQEVYRLVRQRFALERERRGPAQFGRFL